MTSVKCMSRTVFMLFVLIASLCALFIAGTFKFRLSVTNTTLKKETNKYYLANGALHHVFDKPCKAAFSSDFKQNRDHLMDCVRDGRAGKTYDDFLRTGFYKGTRKSGLILVNGHSSNHHREFRKALYQLQTVKIKYKLVVFNLGLKVAEETFIRTNCKFCEMRNFPFGRFPAHVRNLKTYAFKPLIVHMVLQEYDDVLWMDTSVRLQTGELSGLLQHARTNIIGLYPVFYNTTCFTHPQTFAFFNEEPCLFKPAFQVQSGFFIIHSTDFARAVLSYAWTVCALTDGCLNSVNASAYGCRKTLLPDYCQCSRFDQSALTIIVHRLFSKTPQPSPSANHDTQPWLLKEKIVEIYN